MVSSTSSGCEYLDFIKLTSSNAESQQPDGKEGLTMGSGILTSGVEWVLLGSVQIGLVNGFIN
jgi:hypothetical protein